MIEFSEIQPGDLIQVLLNIEDVDDEIYALTKENMGDYLTVNYYLETSMVYKGARMYALDESEELVQPENLCEHYANNENVFVNVENNLYVIHDEIDEDETSTILDESDYESDLDDFIVPDDEIDGQVLPPPGHSTIDREWAEWEPRSPGSRRFKELVDSIEEYAKIAADNNNF
jgi:hypothetical protein